MSCNNTFIKCLNLNSCIFALLALLFIGCEKQDTLIAPTITTYSVTDITETTARSGGQVEQQDERTIRMKGICWSMQQAPTVLDSLLEFGMDAGSFEARNQIPLIIFAHTPITMTKSPMEMRFLLARKIRAQILPLPIYVMEKYIEKK